VADTTVTLICNLTLQPPNAFLMGPNTRSHMLKFLAVWGMIPHLPVLDTEFLGLCGATWACCSIMTPLRNLMTLSLDGSIKNLGRFQNSNVCWMILSKSLNAEVLKVCTYKLTKLVQCFQQQPME
jgi:hypothetical protein